MTPGIADSPSHRRSTRRCPRSWRAANVRRERARGGRLPGEGGEEVDGRSRSHDTFVVLGPRLQVLGRDRRARGRPWARRDRPGDRAGRRGRPRGARRTCRRSRRGSRSRGPGRPRARGARSGPRRRRRALPRRERAPRGAATSLIVPRALAAAPIATSRVRATSARVEVVEVELARRGSNRTARTVTPRSRSRARQVSTFAWWSSSVTTISSPGEKRRPRARAQVERQRRHVGAEGDLVGVAPRKSARASRAAASGRVGLLARGIAPVRVRVVVEQVVGHRLADLARHLRAPGPSK